MNGGLIERRRIALAGQRGRMDLALALDERLADALRASGLGGTGALTVLGPHGYEIEAETLAEDLVEGGLYTLVDLEAVAARAEGTAAPRGEERADHGARWVLLAVAALLLVAVAGVAASLDPFLRLLAALIALMGAFATAAAWTSRAHDVLALRGVVAPAALSFAAGALLIPTSLEDAAHLSIAAGFLAAAVGIALIALMTRVRSVRAAAGTVSIVLVVFGAVWAATLLMHWGPFAAAAISLGAAPLMLRALPSALVNLPDGAFIDYKHFMSNRWTVRGAVPESPATVDELRISEVVTDSWARLGSGTVVLSLITALSAPVVLLRAWGDDPFVISGGIALLSCVVLSLLLVPRHTGSRLLRWAPRFAAFVVLVSAVVAVSAGIGPWFGTGAGGAPAASQLLMVAGGMFVVAVVAVAVTRPISRGARSLAWSRVGDAFEALTVALALPAALLHADILTLLRGMMAA